MPAPGWPPRLWSRGRHRLTRPAVLGLEARVLPATFTVNSFTDGADVNPGDGVARTSDGRTTLRSAVMEANALGGAHTIILPAGSYTLSLSGPNDDTAPNAAAGDLDVFAPIT